MDKEEYLRKADTGIIEIKKLLDCLLKNGYEFQGTRKAYDNKFHYPDNVIADFEKSLSFSETNGNWINDSSLKVSIQFEKRADYTNFTQDENEDDIYIGNPEKFIKKLIKETNEIIKEDNTQK